MGRPGRRPAEREESTWQKHEAGTRQFPGGRMSGGVTNEGSSIRRISQVPHQGGSIVDGAPSDAAEGLRLGGCDDHATSLGQGSEADDAGKSGQCWHSSYSTPSNRCRPFGDRSGRVDPRLARMTYG